MSAPAAVVPLAQIEVPPELRGRPQWVLWCQENRKGKVTKVPKQPNGASADSSDPSTWRSFDAIVSGFRSDRFTGVGFVFSADDPFCGVDVDDCLLPDGTVRDWAIPILERFTGTYVEISPSGTGVKIWCRGVLPDRGRKITLPAVDRLSDKDPEIGLYDRRRYFAFTGRRYGDAPLTVEERQAAVDWLLKQYFGAASAPSPGKQAPPALSASDTDIIERAGKARNGQKFRQLWSGGWQGAYDSQSEADLALCNELAFWTGPDPGRLGNLFRQSGLFREKGKGADYVERTVERALSGRTEYFDWDRRASNVVPMAARSRSFTSPDHLSVSEPPAQTREYLWNDTGNADRLIDAHGSDLIYCEERKGYMVWTGTHWAHDEFVRVERLAEKTLLNAYPEAARIAESDVRRAFLKFLNTSLQRAGITNMVHSAKRKALQASINDFDNEPFFLNCLNGTLDLQAGHFREHRRGDRISKLIPYSYDPKAECPVFMRFLYRIMGSHADATEPEHERAERLVTYLQKAFGCAATGKPEKVLFVLHGRGNNGKTTLLEIIREALGNHQYGGEVQIETLMAKPKEAAASNAINADLADLKGCRFVSSSEVEQGHRLSLARVKYLTGLGQLRARYLHQNFFNYKPTHKLFLDCNHKPVITDPNDAVWNRVKLIPFDATIPPEEIDTDLSRKLRTELPGILRWIVAGAKAYLKDGLTDTAEVQAATEQYRQESDKLAEFLEDYCVIDLTTRNIRGNFASWVPVSALWSVYQQWTEQRGEKYPLGKVAFDERIQRLGCKKGQDPAGKTRVWLGIKFKN